MPSPSFLDRLRALAREHVHGCPHHPRHGGKYGPEIPCTCEGDARGHNARVAELAERYERARDRLIIAIEHVETLARPQVGYGGFPGGDPRKFSPDPECSTEEERAAWREDCARYERGEAPLTRTGHDVGTDGDGGTCIVSYAGYGLGGYEMADEDAEAARDAALAVLAALDGAA